VIELGGDSGNGLVHLVVTILNLLHELLERQAIRRMEGGHLAPEQVEALGTALMHQARTIADLCERFGIDEKDLNIDLGPLGGMIGDLD
jgi:hypothetical protein